MNPYVYTWLALGFVFWCFKINDNKILTVGDIVFGLPICFIVGPLVGAVWLSLWLVEASPRFFGYVIWRKP